MVFLIKDFAGSNPVFGNVTPEVAKLVNAKI